MIQIAAKSFDESRLHFGRHLAAYFLLRQVDRKLRGVTLQLQTRGFARRLDFTRRMPLNSRQISRSLLPDSFRFSRLLPMRVRAQAVNFGLQTGQPAVDFGGTGLGFRANLLCFRDALANGQRARLKPRPALLDDQVTQRAGEDGEVGPGPDGRGTFGRLRGRFRDRWSRGQRLLSGNS